MQRLIIGLLALISFHSFAVDFSGIKIEPQEFENMSMESAEAAPESLSAYPYWRTSATTCYAYTRCPNGRAIYCKVYGQNYYSGYSRHNNSCRFMVLPGRAVRCQGYTQQRDFYGRFYWAYVDVPVSCY